MPVALGSNGPLPVLFYFHGQGGTLAESNSFAALAEATGQLVTVAPKGLSEGTVDGAAWSVGTEGRTDVCTKECEPVTFPSCVTVGKAARCNWATCYSDVAFVKLVLEEVRRDFDVDSSRFFAVGASNGAMLSLHLAAELPGAFAAVVSWYGAYLQGQLPPAAALNGTSLLLLQGGKDETIPEAGGQSYDHYLWESGNATASTFAAGNGCQPDVTVPYAMPFDDHPPHTCTRHLDCLRGSRVVFCDFPTQTHGFWPVWAELMTWWFLRTTQVSD